MEPWLYEILRDFIIGILLTIWFVAIRWRISLDNRKTELSRKLLIEFGKQLHLAHHEVHTFFESKRNETFPWTPTECNWIFEEVRKTTMLEF